MGIKVLADVSKKITEKNESLNNRSLFNIFLKIFCGICDYGLTLAIIYSLRFALQDLRESGCKVTRSYYQLMTVVPFAGLAASFWMAYRDPEPKMVLEKAFYFKLFFWPTLTEDDRGWKAFKRGVPSLLITIALIALTILAMNDEDASDYCISRSKGYTYTLSRWRLISTASYSISTVFQFFVMFF